MIDIHPAHHAATTWRDFFIHIATIVLGLIIAVGLEQTVEFFHHRYQINEARHALAVERRFNIVYFGEQTAEFHRMVPELQGDVAVLEYLKVHPHAAAATWPAEFTTWNIIYPYHDAAWHSAQSVLEMMPGPERDATTLLYDRLALLNNASLDQRASIYAITKTFILFPKLEDLPPAQIDQLLELTATALDNYRKSAAIQRNLTTFFPDFKPTLTAEDEDSIQRYRTRTPKAVAEYLAISARVQAEVDAAAKEPQ